MNLIPNWLRRLRFELRLELHEQKIKRLENTLPKDAHYALQYPDGSYAWESNCQGWGSTPLKPKIGDRWCFTTQQAIWNLRDLKNCKLIRITE